MAGDWSAVLPERQRRELKELLVPRSQPAMSGGGVGLVGRVGWKPGGWEEEEGLGVHALSSLSPLFTKPFRPLLSSARRNVHERNRAGSYVRLRGETRGQGRPRRLVSLFLIRIKSSGSLCGRDLD